MIPAAYDDSLVLPVPQDSLPPDWRQSPPPPSTQRIGDEWADQERSAILRVPSVIVPDEHNYLLNPAHLDFRHIRIGSPEEITIDSRLLR